LRRGGGIRKPWGRRGDEGDEREREGAMGSQLRNAR